MTLFSTILRDEKSNPSQTVHFIIDDQICEVAVQGS